MVLGIVQGTADAEGAAVQDVRVDHGRGDVFVAEKLLDGSDVLAGFQQVGGEGAAEGVQLTSLGIAAARAAALMSRWTADSCR